MASVIVMAVVPPQADISGLLGLTNTLVQNTLRPEQCGHHATLALKPEDLDGVVAEYATAWYFECLPVRYGLVAGGEVCAVFGRLVDEAGQLVGQPELPSRSWRSLPAITFCSSSTTFPRCCA